MSKKCLKVIRKSCEEEPKTFSDRLGLQTEELVERSLNSDLSLSKEESHSISNLKQDWDAIKLLQDDIKKTSDKLKQLGSIGASRPMSDCGKVTRAERKGKIESSQSREIKKLQEKIAELSHLLDDYEKEKQSLLDINHQLQEQMIAIKEENRELKNKINTVGTNKKSADIYKYAQYVSKKIKDIPKWEEMFNDRVSSVSNYLNAVKIGKYEDSFLATLQLLTDLIVFNSKSGNFLDFLQETEKKNYLSDDSENLLSTINAQNERIAKLNKQISDAMISSKELLYSPLAPCLKKDSRASKSTCYTPSSGKVFFITPERLKFKKEAIPELSPDEEFSGKL